jgi:predicted nucleic acid-binding protein
MPIVLDTAVIVAAMDTHEKHHAAAAAALEGAASDSISMPSTILAETMSFVRARFGLEQQRRVWDSLSASGIEIIAVGAELIEAAREIDRLYADVGFGFSDCTLLATCEQERVARVLSHDRRLAVYRPSFASGIELLP